MRCWGGVKPAMSIENVLNQRVTASNEYVDSGNWKIPVTHERDVALALKCVRAQKPQPLAKTLAALATIGRDGWIEDSDLVEISACTGSPIKFLRFAIARVNRWLANIQGYVSRFGEIYGDSCLRKGTATWAGGLPTTVILAGDSSALPAWALSHVLLANAAAVVKASGVEPLSTFRFIEALLKQGLVVPQLIHLQSGSDEHQALIRKAISSTAQSVVYGEDQTIETIYGPMPRSAAHKEIPYWSGRSGTVVLADADLAQAARAIVEGATEDRGNRCISTKKVFVDSAVASDLEALLVREAEKVRRGDPRDEATDLGSPDPASRQRAASAAADGHLLYDRDVWIVRCVEGAALLREEIGCPVLGVCSGEPETLADMANRAVRDTPSGRALVMSVFTKTRREFDQIAPSLKAFKVLWNRPTSYLDMNEPHQGMHLFLELMRPGSVSDEPS
jgi:hypothetical protein